MNTSPIPKHISTLLKMIGFLSMGLVFQSSLHAQCINTFPYNQNFDSGPAGWVSSSIAPGGGVNSWTHGAPVNPTINAPSSAPNCWITGNSPFVLPPSQPYSYGVNEFSAVESPCFDLSSLSNPYVAFAAWWEIDFGNDGVVFQSSIDSGASWQTVGGYFDPVNWYNHNMIAGNSNGGPGGGPLGWSGTFMQGGGSNGWVESQHEISNLAGQPNVKFRFALSVNGTDFFDGFAFDDFRIADVETLDLGADTVICFSDTVVLTGCLPSGVEYSWNTSPLDTLCNLVTISTNQYILTVTDSLGFIIKDTFNLIVSPTNVVLPPDDLICPGDTLQVDAMNGSTALNYSWTPGGETTQIINVSTTGTYTVTVNDVYGCIEVDSISVFVDFVPVVDLGPDTTICAGESYLLDAGSANPGTTYQWTPSNAATQSIIVSAPAAYSVVVTTPAGCITGDSMNLNISLAPVVDLGPDRIACGEFTLNAQNSGSVYDWSTGDMTQTIDAILGGPYWVSVTNIFGCEASDTVNITAGVVPTVDLGPDKIVCNGSSVTLDVGNPGMQYFWSTAETTQTISVSQPGTYIGQATNSQNCTGSDTINVLLTPLTVDLGPDLTTCDGDSILLDGGKFGNVYDWSTGESTQQIYVTTGGTYFVTVMDTSDCVARDTIDINAQPDFDADFSVADSTELYQLIQFTDQSTGAPTSWQWDFGDGTISSDQNPTHGYLSVGVFTVCLIASDGVCTNSICKDVVVDIFESIEDELGIESLELYPNPANDFFNIEMVLTRPKSIGWEIYDVSGKLLQVGNNGFAGYLSERISVDHLPSGLYFVKVKVDEGELYRKVVIQ